MTVEGGRLVGVELPPLVTPVAPPAAAMAEREAGAGDWAALDRWVEELEAYFRGERLAWTADEIALAGLPVSSFDRAVYAALLSVPPAVTVAYGALAEMAGFPRAARAVGNAMASNPVPIVIPCHRVIRSDGSLGNYGSDPAWKEWLLTHEADHVARTAGGR